MTVLANWLNDGTLPQNIASGSWTPSAFNTGKFRQTVAFTNASSHASWRPGGLTYWAILTTNDVNGAALWLEWNPAGGGTHRFLVVGTDGSTFLGALTITWAAATPFTYIVDQSSATAGASTLSISGALTGDGTSAGWTRQSIFPGANLYLGVWGAGGFGINPTVFGDIDDAAVVPSAASWYVPSPDLPKRRSSWAAISALFIATPIVQPVVAAPTYDLAIFPASVASRHTRAPYSGGEFAPEAAIPRPPGQFDLQPNLEHQPARRRPRVDPGGECAPPLQALVAAVPTFFQALFPDEARSRKRRHDEAVGPTLAIDDGVKPLSWSAVFPDQITKIRKSPILGGAFGPEDSIANPAGPLVPLSWSASFPDQFKPTKRLQPTHAEGVLAYGGTPLGIGGSAIRQNIPSDTHYTTTLTTFGSDLAVSGLASGIFTTGTHNQTVCDGPFYIQTDGTFPSNTNGVTATTPVYCIIDSTTTLKFATSALLAKAGTAVNFTSNGSGTFTIKRSVDTSPIGSTFIVFAARGAWDTPGTAPTDSFGNAYTLLAGPNPYVEFSASKYAVYYCINGKGGRNHTWTLTVASGPDEGVIGAIEVYNGLFVNSSTIVERALGSASTISSNSLTTTARARLLLLVGGNGHTSMDHTFTSPDSWTIERNATADGDKSSQGYIQNWLAHILATARGTFVGRASGTVGGNGPEGGQMVLVGVQQLASEPLPLDWMLSPVPDARAPRRNRAVEGGAFGPITVPSAATDILQWSARFPDAVPSRRRQVFGELVDAPRVLTYYDLASFPDSLRSRRRVVDPSLVDLPSIGDARPLTWSAVFPDEVRPRRRIVAGGECAPATIITAPYYDLASFPDALRRRTRLIESILAAPPPTGDALALLLELAGYPDSVSKRRRPQPDLASEMLLVPSPLIVPPLSWSAVFPDRFPPRRLREGFLQDSLELITSVRVPYPHGRIAAAWTVPRITAAWTVLPIAAEWTT